MNGFKRLLEKILPHHHAQGGGRYPDKKCVKKYIVVGAGPQHSNASYDFFLKRRLETDGGRPVEYARIRYSMRGVDPQNAYVIFCRYCGPFQLLWLIRNWQRIEGASFFIDDDLRSMIRNSGAKLHYKLYIYFLGVLPLGLLNRYLEAILVSTRALQEAHKFPCTVLSILPPEGYLDTWKASETGEVGSIRLAYHSKTAIHHQEDFRFIELLAERLTSHGISFHLDVIASEKSAPAWCARNPSIDYRPIMKYEDYLDYVAEREADIFLVPLTDSAVNRVRSANKRIIAAKLNAACLSGPSAAYDQPSQFGQLVRPMEPDFWCETIAYLANNRKQLRAAKIATRRALPSDQLQAEQIERIASAARVKTF